MLIVAAFAELTLAGCAGFPFPDQHVDWPSAEFSNDMQDVIAVYYDAKQVAVLGPFVGPTKPEKIGIDDMGPMT